MSRDMKALIARARATNEQHREVERAHGFVPPEQASLVALLRTAKQALWAGMVIEDWNNVAEGYVMLETLEAALKEP